MMTFEQACAWLRAGGGGAAYCYAPWMERRRWIGLQHCSIHAAGSSDGSLAIRLHGLAVGGNEWKPLHAGPLGVVEALSTPARKAVYSVDPRDYLYAACDGGAADPPRPPDRHGGLATGLYIVQRCLAHRPRLHAAATMNPGENSAATAPARRLSAA